MDGMLVMLGLEDDLACASGVLDPSQPARELVMQIATAFRAALSGHT
jgi:hypothetical protein